MDRIASHQEFSTTFAEALADVPDIENTRFMPAVGPLDADVMLIGEAPGATEIDEQAPFVGRAGTVLDEALADAGLDRENLYITALVKTRPPENRDPHADEIATWRPVLDAELARVDPAIVVLLGRFAMWALTDTGATISQIRGHVIERDSHALVPTFHPAAILYDRDKMPQLKRDLNLVAQRRNR